MGNLVIRVDDFDLKGGVEEPALAQETVAFNFGGVDYYLDLIAERANEFKEVMNKYVAVANRITVRRIAVPPGPIVPKNAGIAVAAANAADVDAHDAWYLSDKSDSYLVKKRKQDYRQAVRAWWRGLGHDIGDYGRVPRNAFIAYEARTRETDRGPVAETA